MFRKQMKKVYRNNKFVGSYVINVGKNDEVDEGKFKANIVEGENDKCEVMVLFGSDYDNLINEIESIKKEVQDLRTSNIEKDNQIKDLSEKIGTINQFYIDKVTQSTKELNKEFSEKITSVSSDKQKEIDTLKDEISESRIKHEKKISKIENSHSKEIHSLDNKYKNTLIRLRTEDNNDISDYTKKIDRIREDFKDLGFFEKHSKTYENLIMELNEVTNEFEKTNKNKLLTIDESFDKLPTIKIDENSEANE